MRSENRCWGLGSNLRRCGRRGPWRGFCDDHAKQPVIWLFVALFTIGPALVTYRSLVREDGLSPEVLQLARDHAVTESALRGFFRALEEEAVPPEALDQRLQAFVREHQRLQRQLAALEGEGAESQRLRGQVRSALDEGDLDAARSLLAVLREATAHGQYGLRITPRGEPFFLEENEATHGITRYAARFFLRPDALRLPEGGALTVFGGWNAAGAPQFYLSLRQGKDRLRIFPEAFDGTGRRIAGTSLPLAAGWRCVEVFWRAGEPEGEMRLRVDGEEARSLGGFHNAGATLDAIRLGAPLPGDRAIQGYLDVDSFASTRGVPIGCDGQP